MNCGGSEGSDGSDGIDTDFDLFDSLHLNRICAVLILNMKMKMNLTNKMKDANSLHIFDNTKSPNQKLKFKDPPESCNFHLCYAQS